ncbi:MAG: hypothetical protein KDD94_06325 [Calditrichaeota bacterium]|nr:hypothetical protein [Calditrichota bacterium]
MDYKKSDQTLKLQLLRMQLELLCYCRIKLGRDSEILISTMEQFWLARCSEERITPDNQFVTEYNSFQNDTLLKFAPEETLINMAEKAQITIKKMGYDLTV